MIDFTCSFCGKDKGSIFNTHGYKVCNRCMYILEGTINMSGTSRIIRTYDGLSIWLDMKNEIGCAWNLDGSSLPKSFLKGKGVIELIKEIRAGVKLCTLCCNKVDEYAGKHFAGSFCNNCWKEYKKANIRKCGRCGQPMYECCC